MDPNSEATLIPDWHWRSSDCNAELPRASSKSPDQGCADETKGFGPGSWRGSYPARRPVHELNISASLIWYMYVRGATAGEGTKRLASEFEVADMSMRLW